MPRPVAVTLLAVSAVTCALSGCESEDKPPPAVDSNKEVCSMPAQWFADATGKADLLTLDRTGAIPFRYQGGPFSGGSFKCGVVSPDGGRLVDIDARLEYGEQVESIEKKIAALPADAVRLEVPQGTGWVRAGGSSENGATAEWQCGSSYLLLTLRQPSDDAQAVQLAKVLAERAAGKVGCTTRFYLKSSPSPSS